MQDFDFANIPTRARKDCADCGQQFRGLNNESRCPDCQHLHEHPEETPMHWTWTRTGRHWTIAAAWPDSEPLPNAGDTVTVHRKDGSASPQVISEIDGVIYDMNGRGRLHCWVEQPQNNIEEATS